MDGNAAEEKKQKRNSQNEKDASEDGVKEVSAGCQCVIM